MTKKEFVNAVANGRMYFNYFLTLQGKLARSIVPLAD